MHRGSCEYAAPLNIQTQLGTVGRESGNGRFTKMQTQI